MTSAMQGTGLRRFQDEITLIIIIVIIIIGFVFLFFKVLAGSPKHFKNKAIRTLGITTIIFAINI